MSDITTLEKILSLCKRRGFIFQGSEIYGGLAGTWDYGPLGLALKKNIEAAWWRHFVTSRDDMFGIDSAILMNPKVWEASGHVEGFHDPLVEDKKTHKRYRADHLLEDAGVTADGKPVSELARLFKEHSIKSPDGNELSDVQQFNMMFRTSVGSTESDDTAVYMRPETAAGMFVNFKNILDSFHPKLPFGIAQIGRAFRNEIAPRDFIFRVRELEIMEFEYFLPQAAWRKQFEYWRGQISAWFEVLGFNGDDIKEVELPSEDLAHYSKRTTDFYFNYPFGSKEIGGLAYRTDHDLSRHMEHAGVDLRYTDPTTGEKFIPHVLEPTFGLGRHVLAVITKAYNTDELGGEARTVLRFPSHLAPVKAAFFPLLKNKPELVEKAKAIRSQFLQTINYKLQTIFDDNGNIGKRYRRQDEIGTPYCITIDFQTLEDDTVTVRDRDTGRQERVPATELTTVIRDA